MFLKLLGIPSLLFQERNVGFGCEECAVSCFRNNLRVEIMTQAVSLSFLLFKILV